VPNTRSHRFAAVVAAATLTAAPLAAQAPAKAPGAAAAPKKKPPAKRPSLTDVRSRYLKTFFRRFPVVATYLGADGLDPALAKVNGMLRDTSPEALRSEHKAWLDLKGELSRVERAALDAADRIDVDVMTAQLGFLLRNLDERIHERALDVVLEEPLRGSEWLLQGMTKTGEATYGTGAEWRWEIDRVSAVPAYLAQALTNIRRGVGEGKIPDRRMIRVAVDAAETTAVYFEKSLPEKAHAWIPESDAPTRRALDTAAAAAAAAFRDFRKGLLTLYFDRDGKTLRPEFDRDRFAAGEEAYAWALKNNLRLSRTPRELHAYGKARVAETLAAMTALAKRIADAKGWPDGSPHAVLDKLSEDVPKDDAEMLAWYRETCQRLVAYGRETGMFDPPADYKLDVIETPPPLRDTIDASYYPAPPFKKTGVGQFYLTPTGNDATKLREHARAAVASLTAHEGFPGHDWYYKVLAAKGISPVRWLTPGGVEDSASMWEDSMSGEGWALYCEQLVGEPRPGHPDGFYTPEERFFQLQNQLLRDARVVVDTGIHCGYMSFDDAVGYFARNVHLVKGAISADPAVNPSASERANVESSRKAIYRYSKWPTQAITYHLGKAAILDLRKQAKEIEGERFDERRFHEEFLAQGSIPPGYFAEALLAQARARAGAASVRNTDIAPTPSAR
jgi:uncharacterized protein (DUF885 family)